MTRIISRTTGVRIAANQFTAKCGWLLNRGDKMMQRNLALALVFMGVTALSGCGARDNANAGANSNNANAAGSPAREGVVETNANIPANANRSSVPANTGVLTNDNGNENTAGVRSVNGNANANRNANGNANRNANGNSNNRNR